MVLRLFVSGTAAAAVCAAAVSAAAACHHACRYNDFKKYADEDAAAEYMYGMECLFRFYSYGLENNFRVPLYKVGCRQ